MCFKNYTKKQIESVKPTFYGFPQDSFFLVSDVPRVGINDTGNGINWTAYDVGPAILAVGKRNLPGVRIPEGKIKFYNGIIRAYLHRADDLRDKRPFYKFKKRVTNRLFRELLRESA